MILRDVFWPTENHDIIFLGQINTSYLTHNDAIIDIEYIYIG